MQTYKVVPLSTSRIHLKLPSPLEQLTPFQNSCITHALFVLGKTSRTFQGESNTETSDDKEKLLFEGKELIDRARTNFKNALATLFVLDELAICSEVNVKQLIGVVGLKLNEGLMPSTRGFWRTWDTPFPHQSKKEEIKKDMEKLFYPEFLRRIHDPKQDAIEFAVWIERTANTQIHPLSDGCGKLSRALATWILGRAGIQFPNFSSREEYFDYLLTPDFNCAVEKYRSKIV